MIIWDYLVEIFAKATSDWKFVFEIALRVVLAVIIGGIFGSERARHGRAADRKSVV